MSKKVSYAETTLVKSRTKKGKFKFLKILGLCLLLVAIIITAGLLSGVITIGNFNFGSLFFKQSNVIKEHSYYLVSMGKYDNVNEAQSVASGAAVMGAGAYVWELNKSYYVVGNFYKSLDEANSVYNNIKGTGNYNITVEEVKFNKVNLNNKDYNKEQNKVVFDSVKFIDSVYEKCFDYSLKIDKNEVNATLVSSELNNLKSECKIKASKLDTLNSYAVSETTINIKNCYIGIIDALDNAILKVINGSSINSDLRYLVANIVVFKYNLYQNIC